MPAGTDGRIQKLGIILPVVPEADGNYVSAKTLGRMVYLSGVVSAGPDGIITGTIGMNRSLEDGYAAAKCCALTQLAVLKRHLGSLDAIKQVITVNGYVNAIPGFEDTPKIMNGASDLLVALFGDAGRHVRAAIGVSALPGNALVEMQMTVEIEA
jgi:enamine deaminase RidA (YjgF/YER057c/UK114 family)